jgi:hypothetical protein
MSVAHQFPLPLVLLNLLEYPLQDRPRDRPDIRVEQWQQALVNHGHQPSALLLKQRFDERVLAVEILIKRANAVPGTPGHMVGGEPIQAAIAQLERGCLQQCRDHLP